ncbi:MAG: hypothetical protein CXR30_09505 [Geobacter sp.]|nr:MAG: hypothetical protein CXR30_09505 [Geobacter sp.]
MNMDKTKLKKALSLQLQMFEELSAVFKQELRAMSEINLDAMAEINLRKEDIATRIVAHSEAVRQAISEAASSEGLSSEATLGELAACLAQKGNEELLVQHKALNIAAERIQQAAAANREIAERFAATVTNSLDLVTRLINQSNVYGASGGYLQRQTGAVMLNTEA